VQTWKLLKVYVKRRRCSFPEIDVFEILETRENVIGGNVAVEEMARRSESQRGERGGSLGEMLE
jgi:hypothetical protein